MSSVSKRITDIQLSIRRVTDLAEKVQDCVRFDIGQPDFLTPANIQDAAIRAIKEGKHSYTPVAGIMPLREAIAESESSKGFDASALDVMVTSGGMGSIFCAMLGYLDSGDEVLLPDPCWGPYKTIAKSIGAVPKQVSYIGADGKVDCDAIASAIGSKTKMMFVNSPSNPDGRVYSAAELKAIADVASEKGITIVSDEVYDHMLYDGAKHVSIRKFAPDNTIVMNSVSKTYAMTGWRIGWMVADKGIVSELMKCNRVTIACPSSVPQWAAIEALRGPQDSVANMIREYQKRKDVMSKLIRGMGWEYVEPKGALYAFPKVCPDSWKYTLELLEKARVAVVPGLPSGPASEGHIRFCFGSVDSERIKEGFERIRKFENL